MSETTSAPPKKPVVLISLFVFLLLVTLGAVASVTYGFYTGVLTPYWTNLSDAHAAVLAQAVFLFGAAWAAVLVPLLFGEQLQNLQAAATRAEDTYARIEARMNATAEQSERELKKIVRLQMMSVGHVLDEQLEFLQTADERNDFVDTRWDKACVKVDAAIARLDGNKRKSIGNNQKRSKEWWDRVKFYGALGEYHEEFRTLSDKAKKPKNSLDLEDLKVSNNASRAIEGFDPAYVPERSLSQVDGPAAQISFPTAVSGDGPAQQLPQ